VNDDPVMIKHIEYQIAEKAFSEGWVKPWIAPVKTGKHVAVIGSGPAGLAAAQNLARSGHHVVVIEKHERPGGLLRYGIPDFKLEKHIIDRRVEQMVAEGVEFQCGVTAGEDISVRYLRKRFDGILLAMGAEQPRDLTVEGRDKENILYAMDFLTVQNKIIGGESLEGYQLVSAQDKTVVVIGGGDTGSDCVGTSRRQGAKKIYQLEILPKPPETRSEQEPWPQWPRIMRTSSSHEEGCERRWGVMTKRVEGNGAVHDLCCIEVEWVQGEKGWQLKELPGTEFTLKADLVLLAMGFVHVVQSGLVESLGLQLDARGNVQVNNFQTSEPWVFAAGDTVRGASLVVNAIRSGQEAAAAMDRWLR
jgi:NAD(P)H-dependent glutamate synthase small subunit